MSNDREIGGVPEIHEQPERVQVDAEVIWNRDTGDTTFSRGLGKIEADGAMTINHILITFRQPVRLGDGDALNMTYTVSIAPAPNIAGEVVE